MTDQWPHNSSRLCDPSQPTNRQSRPLSLSLSVPRHHPAHSPSPAMLLVYIYFFIHCFLFCNLILFPWQSLSSDDKGLNSPSGVHKRTRKEKKWKKLLFSHFLMHLLSHFHSGFDSSQRKINDHLTSNTVFLCMSLEFLSKKNGNRPTLSLSV